MSEPPAVAERLEKVVPGVLHWRVQNANIGGATSSSQAVRTASGSVLVDPIGLADDALQTLTPVSAIVLTAACHQRASWRYRTQLGAPVYLPRGSRETEEEPDETYGAGDVLPGGLEAFHTPGPEKPHYTLLLAGDPGVLFCPDLLMVEDGKLVFVPREFHEDPAETRRSVEQLLDLEFDVLCLDHGPPIRTDAKAAVRRLLAESAST